MLFNLAQRPSSPPTDGHCRSENYPAADRTRYRWHVHINIATYEGLRRPTDQSLASNICARPFRSTVCHTRGTSFVGLRRGVLSLTRGRRKFSASRLLRDDTRRPETRENHSKIVCCSLRPPRQATYYNFATKRGLRELSDQGSCQHHTWWPPFTTRRIDLRRVLRIPVMSLMNKERNLTWPRQDAAAQDKHQIQPGI